MGAADQLIAWARGQIGTIESGGPHGNDGNITKYWDLDHMHWCQGQPWCDAFVSAGFLATNTPVPVFAYCPASEDWYRAHGRLLPADQVQPGDQLFYNIGAQPWPGHTGIALTPNVGGWVTAIEGNTSPGIFGSQDNGGGVYQRIRPVGVVRSVGRPPFDLPTPAPPGPAPTPLPVHRFLLNGVPTVQIPLTIPTDNNGNGWLPAIQNIDVAKMVAVTVQGSHPDRDGRYWPGAGHWQDDGGHPLVSITDALPNARLNVYVVCGE